MAVANIGAAGNGSLSCTVAVPDETVAGGRLVVVAQRSSGSSADMTIMSSPPVAFTRLTPASGVGVVGSGARYVAWYADTDADSVGANVTVMSEGASTGRWLVGAHFADDVDLSAAPVVAVFEPSGTSNLLPLPAAQPVAGSSGGLQVGFVLASMNNTAGGMTFSTAVAGLSIRDQDTHSTATGQSPAMAVLDRAFTGSLQVTQAMVTSSVPADSRATITVLHATSVTTPLTIDVGDDQSVDGGDTVTLTVTASGGVPPYTYAWEQLTEDAVTLSSTTAQSPTFTAPTSGGSFTFGVVVTDDAGDTAADTVIVDVAANTSLPVGYPLTWQDDEGTWLPARLAQLFGDRRVFLDDLSVEEYVAGMTADADLIASDTTIVQAGGWTLL